MQYSYENPVYPEDYIIYRTTEGGENGDYGTHDWFADGVIRTLKNPQNNPDGYNKWDYPVPYQLKNTQIGSRLIVILVKTII